MSHCQMRCALEIKTVRMDVHTSTLKTPVRRCSSSTSSSKLHSGVSSTDGCFPASAFRKCFEQVEAETPSILGKAKRLWSERFRSFPIYRSGRQFAAARECSAEKGSTDMLRRNSARKVHPMPLDCQTGSTSFQDLTAGRQLTPSQQTLVKSSWKVLAADLEGYGLSMTSR